MSAKYLCIGAESLGEILTRDIQEHSGNLPRLSWQLEPTTDQVLALPEVGMYIEGERSVLFLVLNTMQ